MRWDDFLPLPRLLDRDDACHTHSIVKRTIVIVCPGRGELETYGRAISVERLVKLSVRRRRRRPARHGVGEATGADPPYHAVHRNGGGILGIEGVG